MSLLQNSNAISSGGYDLTNSLRFRSSATAYLSRTPITAGNRKTWTWSAWLKRGTLATNDTLWHCYGSATNTTYFLVRYETSGALYIGNASTNFCITTQVFRDPSAWYHLVITLDTTQATATDRLKIYVNGVQVTAFSADNRAAQIALNSDQGINQASVHTIGRENSGTFYLDGYLAEVNFVDGQALTPTSFGETDAVTGSWVAKKYTGTYGNNGFYLPFNHTETNENLLTYSEQFDNAAWVKNNVTITANTAASPLYSSVVADSLYETTANTEHFLEYVVSSPVTATEHTFSCYVKYINRRYIRLRTVYQGGPADISATFDLVNGVVTTNAALYATITSVGGGWYRISMTTKTLNPNPVSQWLQRIHCENDTYAGTYAGDVTKGYHIFGAQVSYGTTTKDYIATTASTITPRGTTENAFTWSQGFNDASWAKNASSITANTTTSPDGTTTASKLVENTASGQHGIYRGITESNITRTLSVYAKLADASRPYVYIEMSDFSAYATNAIFNLSNGTIYQQPNNNPNYTNASASITSVGNGWYRCILTATKGSVNPNNNIQIALCDSAGNVSYTGSGTTLGVFIWGAQLEETSSVGPYWSTGASAQSKVFRIGADKSLGAIGFGYDSWIANNISLTPGTTYDAMTDVPTNTSATVANYPTLNPVYVSNIKAAPTLANANLTTNTAYDRFMNATMALPSSGKFYWEATVLAATSGGNQTGLGVNTNQGDNRAQYGFVSTVNDVWGVAVDMTALTITWYKNNVSQSSSSITANLEYFPFFYTDTNASPTQRWSANFGQRPFSYTPPTGFKALNTFNLPDSTIKKGNKYMDATTYTGNGGTQTITNVGAFKPDFLWIKTRSAVSDHFAFNSVAGSNKYLIQNSPGAETTAALITSFNSNGFSLSSDNGVNLNAATFVGWQWQAGQGTTTTNNDGTVTSTVSVNATAGFSIATYTGVNNNAGATVGHGLGVAPAFVIVKRRDSTGNWIAALNTNGGGIANYRLNTTDAAFNSFVPIDNNTGMTPSNVLVLSYTGGGNAADMLNNVGATYVMYSWAAIPGYSKFGSYTGNGSADGPFVYLGFRPKFLLFKRSDSAANWYIFDTSRGTYNINAPFLFPNRTDAESASTILDVLSNGFKIRSSASADWNANGGTYVYMAFAENPFKNANAR
jgi:hypothetical protein